MMAATITQLALVLHWSKQVSMVVSREEEEEVEEEEEEKEDEVKLSMNKAPAATLAMSAGWLPALPARRVNVRV